MRRGHRGGDARRARLRRVPARRGSRCSTGVDASVLDAVRRRHAARPRGPHARAGRSSGSDYRFAVVSGGFTPGDRAARPPSSGSTTCAANTARDRRRPAHRARGRPGRRPRRQGRGAGAVRPRGRRPGLADGGHRRRRQRPRHARRAPASASPSTPSPSSAGRRHRAVNVPYLDTVLYLLGITREEVEARRRGRGHRRSPPRPALRRATLAPCTGLAAPGVLRPARCARPPTAWVHGATTTAAAGQRRERSGAAASASRLAGAGTVVRDAVRLLDGVRAARARASRRVLAPAW